MISPSMPHPTHLEPAIRVLVPSGEACASADSEADAPKRAARLLRCGLKLGLPRLPVWASAQWAFGSSSNAAARCYQPRARFSQAAPLVV